MESFVENEQESQNDFDNQDTTQTTFLHDANTDIDNNTNSDVIEVDNNNRRIHDDDTKSILSKMNLATRSMVWELEPVEIAYLYSIIRLKVNGKKVMTKKEIHREMLREICKNKRRNNQ